ncbi:MAG TPA: glycosyltransferase family 39 protein, partial [Candidatus Saccharimonadales bacterium]|nr:glycosyltransferase family 39 protein [Candidatus Saccharimonadales bacterium]
FCAVFAGYLLSPVTTSFDSRWTVYTVMSIIHEGNTDLDEYADVLREQGDYAIYRTRGHAYDFFPIGTPLLATPFVFVLDKGLNAAYALWPGLEERLRSLSNSQIQRFGVLTIHHRVEQLIASFFGAVTAVLVYGIARIELDRKRALVICMIFAFCTSAWSTASRALWQHGPSMLMLSAALYLLLLARKRPRLAQYASLPLAYAFVIRPSNAVSIAFLTIYVLIEHREIFVRYVAWSLVVAVPFAVFNWRVYGGLLPPYFSPERIGWHGRLPEALAGNLVSPARGLFVYSPVLLFALWGIATAMRRKPADRLAWALASIVFLHWIVISSFPHWWGGHSYGPRLFTDMLPFLAFFLIPVVARLGTPRGARGALATALFVALASFSLAVHFRGATSMEVYEWNGSPSNVDSHPERIWDWSDPQFLRGLH